MAQSKALYQSIHAEFTASISSLYDCGRICAPLNGGEPVCCTTHHAIPFVHKSEWDLLRGRTDLWKRFRATTPEEKKVVNEFPKTECAVECKGAKHCERENRSFACRSFPFFPYYNREKKLIGLSTFWNFEDRCWVLSNLRIVERDYIRQFISAFEQLFEADETQLQIYLDSSAYMRRAFSRMNRPIPILAADGKLYKILPRQTKPRPATLADFPPNETFSSDENYRKRIAALKGNPAGATLSPDWSIKEWWKSPGSAP